MINQLPASIPLPWDRRIQGDRGETCVRRYRRWIRRYHADQDHDRTGTDAKRRLADQNHSLYTTPCQHRRYPHSRGKEQEIPVSVVAIGLFAGSGRSQKYRRHDGNVRCYICDLHRDVGNVDSWLQCDQSAASHCFFVHEIGVDPAWQPLLACLQYTCVPTKEMLPLSINT